jgi:3,4-dihydroxy 2-butanone 4-phosphate synthase/GTP cyclohydrolase II
VLDRPRAAEAAVDLTRAAGVRPAGVLCEILADDGSTALGDELAQFCATHDLRVLRVSDVVTYRRRSKIKEAGPMVRLPTPAGDFQGVAFEERGTGRCHLALVHGDVRRVCEVPVWVHTGCLAGDVFRSLRCDCREQLERSLEHTARADCGLVLRLGLGANRVDALCAQESRRDAPGAWLSGAWSAHEHAVIVQILTVLGVRSVRMSGVRPGNIAALRALGLDVVAVNALAGARCTVNAERGWETA